MHNNLDSLVVTLETAKKLRAAGFPQDLSVYRFREIGKKVRLAAAIPMYRTKYKTATGHTVRFTHYYDAPTAQEIADQFAGERISVILITDEVGIEKWRCYCLTGAMGTNVNAATMAEGLAALWLKLHG